MRGTLYADGNAATGTPISRFVLDGPVFQLNASGPRTDVLSFQSASADSFIGTVAPLLVEQLMAMGFDGLTLRRGTLNVTTAEGASEPISDIEAELSVRRKSHVAGRGSFTLRGQRLAFEGAVNSGAEKRAPLRWPTKMSLKGDLIDASFEGHLSVSEDLQASGQLELASPSLRRAARWLGVPMSAAEGINATVVKGQLNWARHTLAVEDAKVQIDGNEAAGALTLNLGGERPLIDATLAFNALDLTPYAEAARSRSFLFDRHTSSWSAFDLSVPIIKHVDADLRLSSPKVTLKSLGLALGRGAATITVRSGKLLADIAELELHSGKLSAQITASANDLVPRYTLRGKIENLDCASAGAVLFGAPVLSGRSTLAMDVQGDGQTPAELLRRLSGKATLTMADGGRLGLDMKSVAAAAKAKSPPGWGLLAKGQTNVEQVEVRTLIRDGVLLAETAQARSGATGLAVVGRVDLSERTLDLQLFAKSNVPMGRPLTPADLTGADTVSIRGPWQEPFLRAVEADAFR